MMTRMMITSISVNPRGAVGVFMGFSGSGCFEVLRLECENSTNFHSKCSGMDFDKEINRD